MSNTMHGLGLGGHSEWGPPALGRGYSAGAGGGPLCERGTLGGPGGEGWGQPSPSSSGKAGLSGQCEQVGKALSTSLLGARILCTGYVPERDKKSCPHGAYILGTGGKDQ